jgi:hypothetical protein
MAMDILVKLVSADKLGGWVRAAVGALIAAGIAKYPGLKDIIDPATQAEIGVAVSAVVVGAWSHYVKDLAAKSKSTPIGGPSSMNAGAKGALIGFIALGALLAPQARASDVAKPAAKITLPTFVPCTPIACTGWYTGFNLAGVATNVNVIGNGINGSLNAGGQNIGIQGGYQFWNGTFFFGPEVGIDYTYGGTVGATGGQSNPKYLASEIIKLGTPFSTFFGSAPAPANTTGVSGLLTANTIAPYIFFGAAQSGWGTTGLVSGAGVTFAVDQQHWFVDARYENYQFPSGAANCATGQSCPSLNVVKIGLDYKF